MSFEIVVPANPAAASTVQSFPDDAAEAIAEHWAVEPPATLNPVQAVERDLAKRLVAEAENVLVDSPVSGGHFRVRLTGHVNALEGQPDPGTVGSSEGIFLQAVEPPPEAAPVPVGAASATS